MEFRGYVAFRPNQVIGDNTGVLIHLNEAFMFWLRWSEPAATKKVEICLTLGEMQPFTSHVKVPSSSDQPPPSDWGRNRVRNLMSHTCYGNY